MAGVVDPCWRKPGFVSCDIFLRFSGVLRRHSWRRTGGCCRPRSTPACLAVPCCADGCVRVRVLGCAVWPVFVHRNGSWIPLAQRQLEEDAHGGREDARAQRESGTCAWGDGLQSGFHSPGTSDSGQHTGALRLPPLLLLSYPAGDSSKGLEDSLSASMQIHGVIGALFCAD